MNTINIPTVSLSVWASTVGEDTTEFQEYWLDHTHYWDEEGHYVDDTDNFPLHMTPGEWDREFKRWRKP